MSAKWKFNVLFNNFNFFNLPKSNLLFGHTYSMFLTILNTAIIVVQLLGTGVNHEGGHGLKNPVINRGFLVQKNW